MDSLSRCFDVHKLNLAFRLPWQPWPNFRPAVHVLESLTAIHA